MLGRRIQGAQRRRAHLLERIGFALFGTSMFIRRIRPTKSTKRRPGRLGREPVHLTTEDQTTVIGVGDAQSSSTMPSLLQFRRALDVLVGEYASSLTPERHGVAGGGELEQHRFDHSSAVRCELVEHAGDQPNMRLREIAVVEDLTGPRMVGGSATGLRRAFRVTRRQALLARHLTARLTASRDPTLWWGRTHPTALHRGHAPRAGSLELGDRTRKPVQMIKEPRLVHGIEIRARHLGHGLLERGVDRGVGDVRTAVLTRDRSTPGEVGGTHTAILTDDGSTRVEDRRVRLASSPSIGTSRA